MIFENPGCHFFNLEGAYPATPRPPVVFCSHHFADGSSLVREVTGVILLTGNLTTILRGTIHPTLALIPTLDTIRPTSNVGHEIAGFVQLWTK